jgi:AraC family transcriptional regulator of arabinose operon
MFSISNGGCNMRHSSSFFMSCPSGLTDYLLIIVKSHAHFTINNTDFSVKPDSVIIIDRNTPYHYHNPQGEYANDWLHFECTDDASFRNSGIVFNKFFPVGNPTKFTLYIQQVLWEHSYTHGKYGDINVNLLVNVLINNLILAYQSKDSVTSYSPYYSKLQDLRLTIQAAPCEKYSAKELSAHLGISESYFQHLYTKLFGTSFQSDLIKIRVEHAKCIISTTNFTIEEISEICGYSSEVHFYRQFKKIMGITPTEYRNLFH